MIKKNLFAAFLFLFFAKVSYANNLDCILNKAEALGEQLINKKAANEEIIGSKARIEFQIETKTLFFEDDKRGKRKFEITKEGPNYLFSDFVKILEEGALTDSVAFHYDSLEVFRNIINEIKSTKEVVGIHISYQCKKL
jgi:hypothetical protein